MAAGTILASSSNSWITCWIGLEINLISIIPIIIRELNFKSTETSIKYFLTQAVASVILIVSSSFIIFQIKNYYLERINFLLFLSLSIKAGLAPFHVWFPQVTEFLSWFKCFIIFTWQKIAPFILISNFNARVALYLVIIISAMAGSIGGLNQINTKILLTYSSIAHSAWILIVVSIYLNYWMLYFLVYTLTIAPIIIYIRSLNFKKIKEINSSKINFNSKIILRILILSLGGLPPFLGFTAKLSALIAGIQIFPLVVILSLISSSLISLYFYRKIFFNALTGRNPEKKIFKNNNKNKNFIIYSMLGNLIISIIVLLI